MAVSVPLNLVSSHVSKLVIKCGEKPQCLRNPDFVRFNQKIPRNPDDIKNPDLVENPKKPISGAPQC